MSLVYTLGYAAVGADRWLEELMADRRMMLVDIRFRPFSRFRPAYRKAVLEERFGERYCHVQALGNRNYHSRDLPIELVDVDAGMSRLWCLLEQGYMLCLLCACADVSACHRRLVAGLLRERFGCEVEHV